MDRLKTDMEAPDVARNMSLDAEDAKALKVKQTPEYFVNGKSMPSFGYDQLQKLVSDAVSAAYRCAATLRTLGTIDGVTVYTIKARNSLRRLATVLAVGSGFADATGVFVQHGMGSPPRSRGWPAWHCG